MMELFRVIPLFGAEGGQSSTGSLLAWARRLFSADNSVSYGTLDDEVF